MKSTFMKGIILVLDVPQVTELPVMDIGLFSGHYVSGLWFMLLVEPDENVSNNDISQSSAMKSNAPKAHF